MDQNGILVNRASACRGSAQMIKLGTEVEEQTTCRFVVVINYQDLLDEAMGKMGPSRL